MEFHSRIGAITQVSPSRGLRTPLSSSVVSSSLDRPEAVLILPTALAIPTRRSRCRYRARRAWRPCGLLLQRREGGKGDNAEGSSLVQRHEEGPQLRQEESEGQEEGR